MHSKHLFRFVLFHLALFFVFRVIFYFVYLSSSNLPGGEVLQAFFLGSRFDLKLSVLIALPLILLGLVPSFRPSYGPWCKWLWLSFYQLVGGLALTFVYTADMAYYGYLQSRVNSTIWHFLENPKISFGMVWDSYPVVWIGLGLVFFCFVYRWAFSFFILTPSDSRWEPIWFRYGRPVAFFFLMAIAIHGRLAQYPLRWSDAFFSPSVKISHLALNPILYISDTSKFGDRSAFDKEATKKSFPLLQKQFGIPDNDKLSFLRKPEVPNQVGSPPNVIVIVMESLAYSKTNLMGNPLNPTPYLAKLAEESVSFTNHFSPTEGTARNMFAIMTGTPDVSTVKTSSRNPLVVDQKLIINSFLEYDKYYFVGGSASWANIRGIFTHNIPDIKIFEEGDFEKSSMDVWGLADLDLFIETHRVLSRRKKNKPYFAVIQAASFHRPYDIPENSLDFKEKSLPIEELKKSGFYSLAQFNSLAYSDYSLGHFVEIMRKDPQFDNTLFVITGDHGLPSDAGSNVSAGREELYTEKYHVPLLFLSPKLFPEPKVIETTSSHLDLMTTIATAVGEEHTNSTLGRNILEPLREGERDVAFLYNYYAQTVEYGLIDGKYLYRFDGVKKGRLYEYDRDEGMNNVAEASPEEFQWREDLAKAYFEGARYILYNNQKEK